MDGDTDCVMKSQGLSCPTCDAAPLRTTAPQPVSGYDRGVAESRTPTQSPKKKSPELFSPRYDTTSPEASGSKRHKSQVSPTKKAGRDTPTSEDSHSVPFLSAWKRKTKNRLVKSPKEPISNLFETQQESLATADHASEWESARNPVSPLLPKSPEYPIDADLYCSSDDFNPESSRPKLPLNLENLVKLESQEVPTYHQSSPSPALTAKRVYSGISDSSREVPFCLSPEIVEDLKAQHQTNQTKDYSELESSSSTHLNQSPARISKHVTFSDQISSSSPPSTQKRIALFNRSSPRSPLNTPTPDLSPRSPLDKTRPSHSRKDSPVLEPNLLVEQTLAPAMATASLLRPLSTVLTEARSKAIKSAKDQQLAIHQRLKKRNEEIPPYEFLELIGKGSFGRVFKAYSLKENKIVALKVLEVDAIDYRVNAEEKDDTIKSFMHEITILKQLRDSNVKNINIIYDAFSIHSQLWIVNEYCPGGSLHTLMRATGGKLKEKYIIPVARELAEALKAVHEAGVIHRDVKAANILVCEDGRVQLCDFGVAGVLQHTADKRSSIIGTPFWMPPEMLQPGEVHYGTEVDVWAYGATLYEMATGLPPNARVPPGHALAMTLQRREPRLPDGNYSDGLRGIVEFTLKKDLRLRPTMRDVAMQPYIYDSQNTHPTELLTELLTIFQNWSSAGGQRQSLIQPGGAEAAELDNTRASIYRDDWNFSTSDDYEPRPISTNFTSLPTMDEERVRRGQAAMEAIHDPTKPEYRYEVISQPYETYEPPKTQRFSDLPLRDDSDATTTSKTEIDLGDFDPDLHQLKIPLQGMSTIKASKARSNSGGMRSSAAGMSYENYQSGAEVEQSTGPAYGVNDKRATLEWSFPSAPAPMQEPPSISEEPEMEAPKTEKRATTEWKFPSMTAENTYDDGTTALNTATIRPALSEKRATTEWTFPTMSSDNTYDDGTKILKTATTRPPLAEKRATTEWTFPTMSSEASYDSNALETQFEDLPPPPTSISDPTFNLDLNPDAPPQSAFNLSSEPDNSLAEENFNTIRPASHRFTNDADTLQARLERIQHDRDLSTTSTTQLASSPPPPVPAIAPAAAAAAAAPMSRQARRAAARAASRPSTTTAPTTNTARRSPNLGNLRFPPVIAPSEESMMENADPSVVAAELDRLLSDLTAGLGVAEQMLVQSIAEDEERERRERERYGGNE
ncbi:MAG: hypothetical protein M1834_001660 [Cirrosporium novae-zelandiae]|nr:MAG: hypothetical protein M1834_001660 [Cirrosporium novae-zelandiae]